MRRDTLWVIAFVVTVSITQAQQQPGKVPLVGIVVSGSASIAATRVNVNALLQGLRGLGYVEGKNIQIEYRYAEGQPELVLALIDELIRLKVGVLVVDTSNAINAAKKATKTIPVVFTAANDPLGDGQVASLARPGGNLTGFSLLAVELNGKRLEIIKESIPKVTRVGFLSRADSAPSEQRFKEAESAAKELKLRLQRLYAKGAEDLDVEFGMAKRAGVQAVLGHPSTFLNTNRAQVIDLAVKHRLPVMYPGAPYAEAGGLMSYGPDVIDNWRRAATYVDKIIKGDKPGDLPVQQPMKFNFVINLKAAQQIGLTIPPNVLVRATRVIK